MKSSFGLKYYLYHNYNRLDISEKIREVLGKLKEKGYSEDEIKKTAKEIDLQIRIKIAEEARKYSKKIVFKKEEINNILTRLGQPPTIKEFATIVEMTGPHNPCIHSCLEINDVHITKSTTGNKAFMFFADEQSADRQIAIFNTKFPNYNAKRFDETAVELSLGENSPVAIAASMGIVSFSCQIPSTNEEKIIGGSERKISITKLEKHLLEMDSLLRRNNPASMIPTNVREIRTEKPVFIPLPNEPIDYHELFQYSIEFQPSRYQLMTLETVHATIKRLRTGPRSFSTQTLFELVKHRYEKYGAVKKTIENHRSLVEDYIDYLIKNYSVYIKGFSEPNGDGV